jgi:hypothetical protein
MAVEKLRVKPARAVKKTTSNNLRSTTKSGTYWKTQGKAADGSLVDRNRPSNRVLPKINQLLITEDSKVLTVDVNRVKLIDGKMWGRAFDPKMQKMRACHQGIGNTWVWG